MAISLCLGWVMDHIRPTGSGDPSAMPNSVILPHRSPDSGSFVILYILYHNMLSLHTRL